MSHAKYPLAIGIVIIAAVSAVAGITTMRQNHQAHHLGPHHQPIPLPHNTTAQHNGITTTVTKTPHGKIITTERQGEKDGMQYRIVESKSVPENAKTQALSIPKPKITVTKLPHGKRIVAETDGNKNGFHYHIIESQSHEQLSPQQEKAWIAHFNAQQRQMEKDIQQQMHAMQQQMNQLLNAQ